MTDAITVVARALCWFFRWRGDRLLGSIPRLRQANGAASAKVQVPEGLQWQALDAGGVRCEWLIPPAALPDAALIYLHGGYGVLGLTNDHRRLAGHLALAGGMRALLVNYRLAPEAPFPAGLEDCLAAYRFLLGEGYSPGRLALGGDSAGGWLALSLLLALRGAGDPLPAAAACISPVVDPTLSGASITLNAGRDALLSPRSLRALIPLYTGGHPLDDPLLAPLLADLGRLPPLLVHAGGDEILLDDARRLVERARAAGADVKLGIWPGMWHDFHVFVPYLPEARQAVREVGTFIRSKMG